MEKQVEKRKRIIDVAEKFLYRYIEKQITQNIIKLDYFSL